VLLRTTPFNSRELTLSFYRSEGLVSPWVQVDYAGSSIAAPNDDSRLGLPP
jgi:hypothetical protein